MRTFILASALAATLVPAAAMAQSYGEVRRDNHELRGDRQDLREARAYGDRGDVRDARQELREDRADRREDWRDYRRDHPDVYRGAAYRGPVAGWHYRPVAVGYRFQPDYYGQRYWIDPVRYHLATPGRDTRWVRYGNDVVRVNYRTGRVVEIHNGFFY